VTTSGLSSLIVSRGMGAPAAALISSEPADGRGSRKSVPALPSLIAASCSALSASLPRRETAALLPLPSMLAIASNMRSGSIDIKSSDLAEEGASVAAGAVAAPAAGCCCALAGCSLTVRELGIVDGGFIMVVVVVAAVVAAAGCELVILGISCTTREDRGNADDDVDGEDLPMEDLPRVMVVVVVLDLLSVNGRPADARGVAVAANIARSHKTAADMRG